MNQQVALLHFQKHGYTADVVANGQEAVDALARTPYDIVFMDCQMPQVDGYEATTEIRRREGDQRRTPIIAMTAHAMEGDREKCLAAGMDDYISKPAKPEQILEALERWLPSLASLADANPPVSVETLQDLSNGDPTVMRDLITLYVRDTRQQLERLEESVQKGNAAEVRHLAHTCAGSSASCGVVALVPPLRQLETLGRKGQLADAPALLADVQEKFQVARVFLETL